MEALHAALSKTYEWELNALEITAKGLIATAAVVFALLASPKPRELIKLPATYGRYIDKAVAAQHWMLPAKLAWCLQEIPCVIALVLGVWTADPACLQSWPNVILLAMFGFHYLHRSLWFPFQLRGGKPTPFHTWLMAAVFCSVNGTLQVRYLTHNVVYPAATLTEPHFLVGVAVFFIGMATNWHADYTLINLRKPGETGYKIPYGGAFRFVSGANFFGEIVEWTGFAIAAWALVPASFAIFTFGFTSTRAADHHRWYLGKFPKDYPKDRRAVIPFIW